MFLGYTLSRCTRIPSWMYALTGRPVAVFGGPLHETIFFACERGRYRRVQFMFHVLLAGVAHLESTARN